MVRHCHRIEPIRLLPRPGDPRLELGVLGLAAASLLDPPDGCRRRTPDPLSLVPGFGVAEAGLVLLDEPGLLLALAALVRALSGACGRCSSRSAPKL